MSLSNSATTQKKNNSKLFIVVVDHFRMHLKTSTFSVLFSRFPQQPRRDSLLVPDFAASTNHIFPFYFPLLRHKCGYFFMREAAVHKRACKTAVALGWG